MTAALLICLVPALAPAPAPADPFAPLSFLVGSFEGKGRSPMGPYAESLTGAKALGGTILKVESRSTAAGMTAFQDLRVFSYDAQSRRLRCRQFAFGGVAVYDVAVKKDGQRVVLTEAGFEGKERAAWRYVFEGIDDGGFSYRVDTKRGDGWRPYVSGKLARKDR